MISFLKGTLGIAVVLASGKFIGTISCSQSYKGSTIVNYGSRVVIWGIFKSGTTLESSITIVEAL